MTSEPLLVTQLQLAAILGVDRNTLAAWTRLGMPVQVRGRGSRGHSYDLGEAVRWLRARDRAQHERALAAAKSLSATDTARARKWNADARRSEIETKIREGETVLIRDVELSWSKHVVGARTVLLGVPTRLKGRRPLLTHEDIAAVDLLIREALEELAGPRADDTGSPHTGG